MALERSSIDTADAIPKAHETSPCMKYGLASLLRCAGCRAHHEAHWKTVNRTFRRREGKKKEDIEYMFHHKEGTVTVVRSGVTEGLPIHAGIQDTAY